MFCQNNTYRKRALFMLLGLLACTPIIAQQAPEQLSSLINRFRSEEAELNQLLAQKQYSLLVYEKDGTLVKPVQISAEGLPLYYEAQSLTVAEVTRSVSIQREAQMNTPLTGKGAEVGIWDAGAVRDNHQELTGRVFQWDQALEVNAHATEVSSVLLAQGIKSEVRGMLPEGQGRVYDWHSDRLEVAEAAEAGLRLSNHSYGIKSENVPDWYFGCYITASRDWDALMYAAPHYLLVNAAGNSRGLGHNSEPLFGSSQEGFDELLGFSVSKNSLTVGSANLNWSDNTAVSAIPNSYSSIGPTDDGRIKPDLVSDGTLLETATSANPQAYTLVSGTSMAAPAVSGGLLQLQEYSLSLGNPALSAASLKGLALHTATEIGAAGPEIETGWGAFNALTAIHFLQQQNYSSRLEEGVLNQGDELRYTIEAREIGPLKISLSWTDPPGEAKRLNANEPTPVLVNDLDIRLYKEGQQYDPWVIRLSDPGANAHTGDNRVDPYEQIVVIGAQGNYELVIKHKGELKDQQQVYSLLISGARFSDCELEQPQAVQLTSLDSEHLSLSWASSGASRYRVGYRQLGEDWQYVVSEENTYRFEQLNLGGFYEFEVYGTCGLAFQSRPSEPLVVHYQEGEQLSPLSADPAIPKVFPNPAGAFMLTSASMNGKNYQIIDASGTVIDQGRTEGSINTAPLSSGLYFLQIQTEGTDWTALKFYKD
jgi:hypothetical protein